MKLKTVENLLTATRFGMAAGVGFFVREVCVMFAKDKHPVIATGYWLCGMAAVLVLGDGVNRYIDDLEHIAGITDENGCYTEEYWKEYYGQE